MSKNLHNSKIFCTFVADFVDFCNYGTSPVQYRSNIGPLSIHYREIF